MKNSHIRLALLGLFLVLASLFVPKTADTKDEYRFTSVGYPIPFIEQSHQGYLGINEMYPRRYAFSNPYEIPTDFRGGNFLFSWLITFLALEGLWFLSQQSTQKHARAVFLSSALVLSVASVVLLNTYHEKREEQEKALQQSLLTTLAHPEFNIIVRYDDHLLKVESNTESSLLFSSSLGLINIHETPSTDSFRELSSPTDAHPLQGFMTLERFDEQGLTGYKRWDVATQPTDSPSRILYRFHRGDSLLEITVTIAATDPYGGGFKTMETIADELVRNIQFDDGVDVANRTIPKTWVASIDPESVSDTMPLDTQMNYSALLKGRANNESTTISNADLGIALAYDPTIFSVTEKSDGPAWGVPTLELESDLLRVTFHTTTLEEFASIEQPQLRGPIPLERVMMIARYDRAGFAGYRQWDWIVQNQEHISMITYRFHRGSDALEIQGWIDETDPTSERFGEAERSLELLVENMWFEGHEEKTRGVVQRDLFPTVSENMIYQ